MRSNIKLVTNFVLSHSTASKSIQSADRVYLSKAMSPEKIFYGKTFCIGFMQRLSMS